MFLIAKKTTNKKISEAKRSTLVSCLNSPHLSVFTYQSQCLHFIHPMLI